MGNLDEATKRMASAMNQISEIITTNGMDAICILQIVEAGISATPLIIHGSSLKITLAIVESMLKSPETRNLLRGACEYYKIRETEKRTMTEMPPYLEEFIDELLKKM